MKKWMPLVKLIVIPGVVVVLQRTLDNWKAIDAMIPHTNFALHYGLDGLLLLLRNPLMAWIKDQGA